MTLSENTANRNYYLNQNIAAVTTDLWPSMSNLLAIPWKQVGRIPTTTPHETIQRTPSQEQNAAQIHFGTQPPRPVAPLLDNSVLFNHDTLPASDTRANPKANGLSKLQQQRFLFGGPSQTIPAQEENCKQQPKQRERPKCILPGPSWNGFGQLNFASNAATEAIYSRALERIGADPTSGWTKPKPFFRAAPGRWRSGRYLQSGGDQVGVAKRGTGAEEEHLYVVVDESMGSAIVPLGQVLLVLLDSSPMSLWSSTILSETTGVLKNIRGSQNNEAQPEHGRLFGSAMFRLRRGQGRTSGACRFSSLGGELPKGVLLVGPLVPVRDSTRPCGGWRSRCSLLLHVRVEFDGSVGVGAKRVRDLFTQARGKSPAIIFIDELDAICAKRNRRDAAHVEADLEPAAHGGFDGFLPN
ncbi:ATPase AAA-type core [Penicillium verhagenii]|nr:ATPase AAA-type core [Penicillium verhagenii]